MKLYQLLVLLLILFSSHIFAQKTVYFNENWLSSGQPEASYYSEITTIEDGKYLVKDFSITGELLTETEYQGKEEVIEWERLYEVGFHEMAVEDGNCIEYYLNGNKKKQFTYTNGKQSGNVRMWLENGTLFRDFIAENNIANGLYLEYYENGKASLSVTFRNDTLNGPAAYYHPNGEISHKGSFKSGKKSGNWIYRNDKGEDLGTESYRDNFFIEGPDITIGFPGANWCLSDQFKDGELMNFIFSRTESDKDLVSRQIPTCVISLEYIGNEATLLEYSSHRRRRLDIDIHKVISKEQELFSLENSMGYLGSYIDKKDHKHSAIVYHTIQNGIGVELMLDIRREDYESLKKEVVYILRSIKK